MQIIAVSHLAQIAALAYRDCSISKREEGGRTFTVIRDVEGDARILEIARLIGGDTQSDAALQHARELLRNAQIYKKSLS